MQLRTSAIYSLKYEAWKFNPKIYAFILWPGSSSTKVHLLNLSAKQLNIIGRAKLLRGIVKLSKTPGASKFNGRVLYQLFKTYFPQEIKVCYRTFFLQKIYAAALINYGLNLPEEFTTEELRGQSSAVYNEALKDYQVKAMNWYSKRGYTTAAVKKLMDGGATVVEPEKPLISGMQSATKPAMRGGKPVLGSQYQKAWDKIRNPLGTNDVNIGDKKNIGSAKISDKIIPGQGNSVPGGEGTEGY